MNRTLVSAAFVFLCPWILPGNPEQSFRNWDQNGDGVLEAEEVPEGPRNLFNRVDADGNGKVTLEEHLNFMNRGGNRPPGPPQRPERPDRPSRPGNNPEIPDGVTQFSIEQTWDQEPNGHEREVLVRVPENVERRQNVPVVVFFHGNGGNSRAGVTGWVEVAPDAILVSPQGYERSWNIHGERSLAPDVEFFGLILDEVSSRWPNADLGNVSLVGSSNGGGFIHRLMIEDQEGLFQKAVPTVSSLLQVQFHDSAFWKGSAGTENYDERVTPRGNRRILYVHGTDDAVVPFDGGMRSGVEHISAYETAFAWAKAQGFEGEMKTKGTEVADGILEISYEGHDVTLLELVDGNHGMGPYGRQVKGMIAEFLAEE